MTANPPPPPKDTTRKENPAAGRAPVIRATPLTERGDDRRKKYILLLAWLFSLLGHIALGIVLFIIYSLFAHEIEARTERSITAAAEQPVEKDPPPIEDNEDIGRNPEEETNYDLERIEPISVPGKDLPDQPVGIEHSEETVPMTVPPLPGAGDLGQGGGVDGLTNPLASMASTGGQGGMIVSGFAGRSGATRLKTAKANGGNDLSEAAVARGLNWLARHQAPDGTWSYDRHEGTYKDVSAATAMALLPFLAAGQTHVSREEMDNPDEKDAAKKKVKYRDVVAKGLRYLLLVQKADGSFGTTSLYGHAICTMALCEAYGMTNDRAQLFGPAQKAILYMAKAQHSAGGWRYSPNQAGDVSVAGWCIQAMQSGKLAKLAYDPGTFIKAAAFLKSARRGTPGTPSFGFCYDPAQAEAKATLNMTSVGLLCMYYLGWNGEQLSKHSDLLDANLPKANLKNFYYWYYATQVMHYIGGSKWEKWNASMRDLLIATQEKGLDRVRGSWAPDTSHTGHAGGRLCSTIMALLTLEVYYRHLPLYRRDQGGLSTLDIGL